MKKYLPFLLVMLFLLSITPAFADSPQPLNWMYAAVKCTSLPLETIQTSYKDFADQYGADHNFTPGGEIWILAYPNMVNEFVRQYGCSNALNGEGTRLTVWFENYRPVYIRALVPKALRGAIP